MESWVCPRTPGELKQRTDRLHPFASLTEVEATLDRLIERELAVRLGEHPAPLEGGALRTAARQERSTTRGYVDAPRPALARDPLEERVAALEAEVAALKAELGVSGDARVTCPTVEHGHRSFR